MKNLTRFSFFILFALSLGFISCEKEGTDDPTDYDRNPSLTLEKNGFISGNLTVGIGDEIRFKLNLAQNEKTKSQLVKLLITRTSNDTPENLKDTVLRSSGLSYVFTTNASEEIGYEYFTFKVVAEDGTSSSKQVRIKTREQYLESGEVWIGNYAGKEPSSFDFITDSALIGGNNGTEASRDMQNTDKSGLPFTGSWTSGKGNGTRFVKIESTSYDYPSDILAQQLFLLGTPSLTVNNPQSGDFYLAKLRGANDYAFIKIIRISPTDGDGAIKGRIYFTYKK